MEITIISPLNKELQVWTFQLTESEFCEAFEKFNNRGCSVLVSQDEVSEEIKDIYK